MAILDTLKDTNLGLGGETPKIKVSATDKSPNLVFDPKPGNGGDEEYNINSDLDLDGKAPKSYRETGPEEASF